MDDLLKDPLKELADSLDIEIPDGLDAIVNPKVKKGQRFYIMKRV